MILNVIKRDDFEFHWQIIILNVIEKYDLDM